MTTEEQILASIEEIGTKLEELKKLSKNVPSNNSIDLSGIEKSLIGIDAKLITQKIFHKMQTLNFVLAADNF